MWIFDAEFNGLHPDKMHVFSASQDGKQLFSTKDPSDVRKFFDKGEYVVGHNIARFDLPVLERLCQVPNLFNLKFIDTLFVSWYLYPNRNNHGLESWGEDLGYPKVQIEDWDNLTYQEYKKRCERDVEINYKLWKKMESKLLDLYPSKERAMECVEYLSFKARCVSLAHSNGWKLNVDKAIQNREDLTKRLNESVEELKPHYPLVVGAGSKSKPKACFKKDGSLSAHGVRWFSKLKEMGLPEDTEVIPEEPNPLSIPQTKNWLNSIGWKPCTYKENHKGEQVPQVCALDDKSQLTESVLKLADRYPAVHELAGLMTLKHRLGIVEGFLETMDDNGFLHADIGGLTNTLRLKHKKPLVNLPAADSLYGEYVRELLIPSHGCSLVGSDMASLEDRTKQHYMWPHDPQYVKEMQVPDFDPHLDIALEADMMTKQDVDDYKKGYRQDELKQTRHLAKTVNYSATYGVGAPKLSRQTGMTIEEAEKLLEAYWTRNKAIDKIAEECKVKEIKEGDKTEWWLFNPVSKLWYSLRHPKDRFSTLNQGTGSYAFDTYLGFVLQNFRSLVGQFHDEFIFDVPREQLGDFKDVVKESIEKTNNYLKLNRKLDVGLDKGTNYSEIH